MRFRRQNTQVTHHSVIQYHSNSYENLFFFASTHAVVTEGLAERIYQIFSMPHYTLEQTLE